MSIELGLLSQQALTMQQLQMKVLKNTVDMQQYAIETLLTNNTAPISSSENLGQNVDVSI